MCKREKRRTQVMQRAQRRRRRRSKKKEIGIEIIRRKEREGEREASGHEARHERLPI
jgi:hypothetical protein